MERSKGAVETAFDIQVDGKPRPGRPKMTWKHLTERDCREWKLSAIDLHDLFVLRFYGPVNPMGSCLVRSVYLTTRLLGRLSPLCG